MRALALLPVLWFAACFPYSRQIEEDRSEVLRRFPASDGFYRLEGRTLHYVQTGSGPDLVVFVHGSPGSWEAFAGLLKDGDLGRAARLISVDRPGFGLSNPGVPEPSLERQATLIAGLVREKRQGGRVVLVGHSFGGPVVARMAMLDPQDQDAIVLVAASVDPDLEIVHWYQYAGNLRPVRWILPEMLDVTNQEILPLRVELQKMLPLWPAIRSPAVVIQGDADDLVPPGNADFLAQKLAHVHVRVERIAGMNHFIPWSRPELIKDAILSAINQNRP